VKRLRFIPEMKKQDAMPTPAAIHEEVFMVRLGVDNAINFTTL
jgi:hypothetical protein